jgi:hypothetical protein
MNKAIRFFLVSMIAVGAQAFAAESLELAPTMKEMRKNMMVLGKAFAPGGEATPKADLELAAKNLADLIVVAATKAPHQMVGEDGKLKPEFKDAIVKFDETLNRLLAEVKNLQAALAKDDRAAAADILKNKIGPIIIEGHHNFRETE